jgi:hypothetical protein
MTSTLSEARVSLIGYKYYSAHGIHVEPRSGFVGTGGLGPRHDPAALGLLGDPDWDVRGVFEVLA